MKELQTIVDFYRVLVIRAITIGAFGRLTQFRTTWSFYIIILNLFFLLLLHLNAPCYIIKTHIEVGISQCDMFLFQALHD